jgi:protein CpxP
MKKILMLCCFVLGISAASFAQGGGRQRMNPEEQAKALQTQLKLDDAQTAKITAIFQTQAKSMDSVRTAANGDRQAMMQASAYDKMVAEMRNRQGGQGGGGNPPPSQK